MLKRVVLTQNVRGGCGNQYRGNSVEDEERQYFVLIPQAASESATLPVIVVFRGQGGDFYRMIGQFQPLVNKGKCIAVFPAEWTPAHPFSYRTWADTAFVNMIIEDILICPEC